MCGGRSSRMGTDKSMMVYHDKPQWQHLYELLTPLCSQVSISCNSNQASNYPAAYPRIVDELQETGPLAGLHSAFSKYPKDSFLVVGCDYPLVTHEDLHQLVTSREEGMEAVCFFNPVDKVEEPLLAIYESTILSKLKAAVSADEWSLRNLLRTAATRRVPLPSSSFLTSVDTPETARKIRSSMK